MGKLAIRDILNEQVVPETTHSSNGFKGAHEWCGVLIS